MNVPELNRFAALFHLEILAQSTIEKLSEIEDYLQSDDEIKMVENAKHALEDLRAFAVRRRFDVLEQLKEGK